MHTFYLEGPAQTGETVIVNTCTVNGDLAINKDITVEAADGAAVPAYGRNHAVYRLHTQHPSGEQ